MRYLVNVEIFFKAAKLRYPAVMNFQENFVIGLPSPFATKAASRLNLDIKLGRRNMFHITGTRYDFYRVAKFASSEIDNPALNEFEKNAARRALQMLTDRGLAGM